ncbi:MAG: hypothetical protein Q7S33_01520 [Nanoarchaeota archaeon]|nr:hypothetical protein [Nanoarchaeota archaeon]
MVKKAQLKIQQMAFMIVAVFFFLIMAGLIFLSYQSQTIKNNYDRLQKDQAISSLQILTNMPELTCGYLCLDEDKLEIMSKKDYSQIWPVASIEVYKIYPVSTQKIKCPGTNCNYYNVYDSNQQNIQKYSTYVSLCKKVNELEYIYDKCEIARLVVGVKTNA